VAVSHDVHLFSEFRLKPARAGLNAVAIPRRRNLQAGTAILNMRGFDYVE